MAWLPVLLLVCLAVWLLSGMVVWSYALLFNVRALRDRTMEEIESLTATLGHAMKTPLQRLQLDLEAAKLDLSKGGDVTPRLVSAEHEVASLGRLRP